MRQAVCTHCAKQLPLGHSLCVFDQVLCPDCAKVEIEKHSEEEFQPGSVSRQVDPTVCARCQMDNGESELPVLAGFHACDSCYYFLKHRPFPLWLKSAFGFLVILLVVGLVRNWPYFQAYMEWRKAERLFQRGDIEGGRKLVDRAATRVPGSNGLGFALDLIHATNLVSQDKAKEALAILQRCKAHFPNDPHVNRMLLSAESSAAFDDKNYDLFLKKNQDLLVLEPNSPWALSGVSSAYACKFAVSGNEEFKEQALSLLGRAEKLARPGDAEFLDMKERIHYRLDTREIISPEEYHRRLAAKKQENAKP